MGYDVEAALDEKLEQLRAMGFDAGAVTGETNYAGDGAYRPYEYATLFAHPQFGVHEVHGLIGAYYFDSLGGPEGGWGFPLSDEYADGDDGRASDFEGGTLTWSPEYGVLEIYPPKTQRVAPDEEAHRAEVARALSLLVTVSSEGPTKA